MNAKQWLNSARFATWWLDLSDLGWPDSRLTGKWEHRARLFQEKGVNAVVLSGFHFRWDYHFIFDRIFGALNEITDICHQKEIKVVERHCATRIHRVRGDQDRRKIRQVFQHDAPFYADNVGKTLYRGEQLTDWRQISARDGEAAFIEDECSDCLCPNHPGFQQAYLDYIQRHLAAVPIDAMMSEDLQFLPDVYSCACSHCQQRFQKEAGIKLPPVDDRAFWENRKNPDFRAWIQARYRWNADHYKRLRSILPKEILLWASASSCVRPDSADTGTSPQIFTEHFDAVCQAISPLLNLDADQPEILAEMAGFASLARSQEKPLLAQFCVESQDQTSGWLHFLANNHARPWVSKQILKTDVAPEEELLAGGYGFDKIKRKPAPKSLQAIAFSAAFRDSLLPDEAEDYVESYRLLSSDLLSRGSVPYLLFDNMWASASPESWECLWILDPRALDEEKSPLVEKWQEQGLAIGTS